MSLEVKFFIFCLNWIQQQRCLMNMTNVAITNSIPILYLQRQEQKDRLEIRYYLGNKKTILCFLSLQTHSIEKPNANMVEVEAIIVNR